MCLLEQLRHVRDQYAPCTTYILAWMSLYAQGMWPLLAFCVPFAFIFNEKPELLGASSWEFYTLQAGCRAHRRTYKQLCRVVQQSRFRLLFRIEASRLAVLCRQNAKACKSIILGQSWSLFKECGNHWV